ncbi:MAG: hypothetical protein K1X94_12830 [Sandaracinaceae bacterium]|nr:hypothetical protein [Sandaracinaceae bacterium]
MRRTLFGLLLLSTMLSFATIALGTLTPGVSAQEDDEEEEDEAPAQPAAPTGPRTESGRTEVSAVIDRRGAILELHSKARLFIPPDLPVANRRVRFAESRDRVTPTQIAAGFTRIGPLLSFDGAINATSAPVVVSLHQPRDPSRRSARLVLAMEGPSICREGSAPLPGASAGICSGWELLPATWSASEQRLSGEMRTPGGYRLAFGTVPCAEGDTSPGCPQPAMDL